MVLADDGNDVILLKLFGESDKLAADVLVAKFSRDLETSASISQ